MGSARGRIALRVRVIQAYHHRPTEAPTEAAAEAPGEGDGRRVFEHGDPGVAQVLQSGG
jgi:hypothetical protein